MTKTIMVEGSIEKVTREEIIMAIKAVKPGKVVGPRDGQFRIIKPNPESESFFLQLAQST